MQTLNADLEERNIAPLPEADVRSALRKLEFKESLTSMRDGKQMDEGWYWVGLELLPTDASDNDATTSETLDV